MLYEALSTWKLVHPSAPLERLGIVFHTSCVNYELEDLRRLFAVNAHWILPDNIYWELRLLLDSPQFRERAAYLLTHASHEDAPSKRWDLEQLDKDCADPVSPERIYSGALLFLFGDLNRQDEFLKRVRPREGMYILLCDEWSRKAGQYTGVRLLTEVYGYRMRQSEPLDNTRPRREPFEKIPALFTAEDGSGLRLSGSDFKLVDGMTSGRHALVYRCEKLGDCLVKGYRKWDIVGSREEKLRMLQIAGKHPHISALPLALPKELLFSGRGCSGFSMRKCEGKSIYKIIHSKEHWKNYDARRVLKNLFLLLLELHTRHMLVNDLSPTNVLVDEDNRVSIIDCDSFQLLWYPGQDYPKGALHPELDKTNLHRDLRDQRHEAFTLATLLFQCVFLYPPLLANEARAWTPDAFPLDVDGETERSTGVNKAVKRHWMEDCDPEMRRAFSDEFHFRRDLSVGAWVRPLKLEGYAPPIR